MAMTNIEKAIRKVEAELVATGDQRRAEALALTEELSGARAALEDAESVPDALLSAVRAGEDVSHARLSEARAAVEIATAKVEGLTARLAAVQRGLAPQDTEVADLLVPLFQRSLLGVPVLTTIVPARQVIRAVNGNEGPALVLCQESDTKRSGDGFVATDRVNVIFVRPSWAGEADVRVMDLENAARKMAIGMRVTSNGHAGHYQTFTIRVEGAVEAVPLIAKADKTSGINAAMQAFGAQVNHRLGQYPQLPTVRGGVYSYSGADIRMDLTKPEVTEHIDVDGVRTVRLTFQCHILSGNTSKKFLWPAPRTVEPEGFAPHVGRIKAIEVTDTTSDPRRGTVSQRVVVTYVSRVK